MSKIRATLALVAYGLLMGALFIVANGGWW